ncbi:MAG TPA: glycoside hydrolase family 2 TIM barrel-domain containing protein [Bryobacteraceae bacterium]|nr:glycoside hydrolase family 2 TIM barrel-domain containing protein [Bryobacteraceae bacterium]
MLRPARIAICFCCFAGLCAAQRITISLDGIWQITDSVSATDMPKTFDHTAPVPGLAHSSTPAFPNVDEFNSREHIVNLVHNGELPKSALVTNAGVSHQKRNYFWYRTTFTPRSKKAAAILKINKAQFGTAVWVNGKMVGEHLPCFSAAYINITDAIRWSGSNELVIRVGAHPGVLPASVSAGTDFEKVRWTPGIYDDVSLLLSDNPVIETVQVAPYISPAPGITVQTKLKNFGAAASFDLKYSVHPWKESGVMAEESMPVSLGAGEEQTLTRRIDLPDARLWSPEEPNLYVLDASTGGDSSSTRFGVRTFRFDTATRRAYLNGRLYFMRGSNITLHRFFEDPLSGTLPWNEAWVRKALVTIPKQMHWNAFRFCIGPVPDKWLAIADEAGLLIQNEYFVWTGGGWFGKDYQKTFDNDELIGEYEEWMRDNWNHPSLVIWDANNETANLDFTTKIIPAVRSLDLSNRPWENSYNPPAGANDPAEYHPYFFQSLHGKNNHPFEMTQLEGWDDAPFRASVPTGHAEIVNEYGWLWLNRDGSPTKLTGDVYAKLLGPNATAQQRLKWNAYLLAGLTEFWRAYRHYAGVDHFVYLTGCDPQGFTCDNFQDVRSLKLNPLFQDYVSNAFAPLGVYINFWHPKLTAGAKHEFEVMLLNDDPEAASGQLMLDLEDGDGKILARKAMQFEVAAQGQMTYAIDFDVPKGSGKCILKAIAQPSSGPEHEATVSRRWVELVQNSEKTK